MEIFDGAVQLSVKPWTRHEVVAGFRAGQLVISDSDGGWLGDWSVLKVTVDQIDDKRLDLAVGKERFRLEMEDSRRFRQAFETEIRHLLEMSPTQRLIRYIRLPFGRMRGFSKAVHVRKREADRPLDLEAGLDVFAPLSREDDVPMGERDDPGVEATTAVSPRLAQAQKDAVDALRSAMDSWFGYYFLLGEGTDQDRLHTAANGLQKAALHLRDIAKNLESRTGLISTSGETFEAYRSAVEGWSSALDLIARGAVLDHREMANDGFARFDHASAIAEKVVDVRATSGERFLVTEPLTYLSDLTPAKEIARDVVQRAKQPWRRAVIAAGSPFRGSNRQV